MPKVSQVERTPNPNALRFILNEPLTFGTAHAYDTIEQAQDDVLARTLFDVEHVTNVFYVDHWITVTQDGGADWQELMRKVVARIRAAAAVSARSAAVVAAAAPALAHLGPDDRLRLDRFNTLLDNQIRPYLRRDGGDLHVLGLDGNTLTVHYQGACGSCPRSIAGTLTAIENLLRSLEPDIEVVAA